MLTRERPDPFSLYPELRVCAWAGAMLLAAAAGIVLKKNLDRIGPLALATLIGAAALACYAWVWWRRARATIADDYILLLAALLVSADVAFLERQFHLLDHHWPRHFLSLAVVHGVTAYAYRSRTLLSLSIAALAAWLGIERRDILSEGGVDLALRASLCASLLVVWRQVHRRWGGAEEFLRVFEHFAANLALWGGLFLMQEQETFELGCAVTVALAVVAVRWGFVQRSEAFVLYAFVYALLAAVSYVLSTFPRLDGAWVIFVSMAGGIATLVAIHRRFAR